MPQTWRRHIGSVEFMISTDRSRISLDDVHAYLTTAYWSAGVTKELQQKAIAGSAVCIGVYRLGEGDVRDQIGFARWISDNATFAYLTDVYVLSSFGSLGLGKWLLECCMHADEVQTARRYMLLTKDAQLFYERYGGFKLVEQGEEGVYTMFKVGTPAQKVQRGSVTTKEGGEVAQVAP